MNSEHYTDNVPDMSGPSCKSNNYRSFVLVKLKDKTINGRDKFCKVPFNPWSTAAHRRTKSYTYYKIKLIDDNEHIIFYVKSPSTFPKENLENKICQFIEEEFGSLDIWEFVGTVSANLARNENEWVPCVY